MTAELLFPGDVHCEVRCAMAADAALQAFLRVTGSKGELAADNPIAPHIGHRLRVRTGENEESEQVEGRTTYDHQLEAFVAAVVDGQEQPTGGQDAIANMRAIEAIYRAAGMQPRARGMAGG
jgi:predicted dehydrogenase